MTPVLTMEEAPHHPHNAERQSFVPSSSTSGSFEPKPAPRLSRTPGTVPEGAKIPKMGQHTVEILAELGYSKQDIEQLLHQKVIRQTKIESHL